MFQPEQYITSLTALLKDAFQNRLLYVGLQGSYLRGEATPDSDIDIMVVIRDMSPADLDVYRGSVEALEDSEKSCGFICGQEELQHWNPLEICHLLHTTKDHYGALLPLVPRYTEDDVRAYVQVSLGNLYHEICHRRVHASLEVNQAALPDTYKAVFFILQNLHYLESGTFIGTKRALLAALSGQDKQVLETALSLRRGADVDFEEAFSLLFVWCGDALKRTSKTGQTL